MHSLFSQNNKKTNTPCQHKYWQRVTHLIFFEANLWILLIQLLPAANASSAAASLQRMKLASTKNFIIAVLPRIFALTAAANILRFPSHFFKRKLKNLKQWDARCFFEPLGQVRWLNICPGWLLFTFHTFMDEI